MLISRALAAGGQGTICGMANLVPTLLRRLFRDADAQAAIEQACEPIDGIPLLKAALAAMTGEAIWRNVRPPLRAPMPPQACASPRCWNAGAAKA